MTWPRTWAAILCLEQIFISVKDLQTAEGFVLAEDPNFLGVLFEDLAQVTSGNVAGTKPNDLRRVAVNNTSFVKVGILSDYGELVIPSVFPNFFISS